jgi:hypothetical protein
VIERSNCHAAGDQFVDFAPAAAGIHEDRAGEFPDAWRVESPGRAVVFPTGLPLLR